MEPQILVMMIGLAFNFVAVLLTAGGILFAMFRFASVALERLARVETKQDETRLQFSALERRQAATDESVQDLMRSRGITPRRHSLEG